MRPNSHQRSRSTLSNHFHTANTKEEIDRLEPRRMDDENDTPDDKQLVLLCLDYLRSLRRTKSVSRHDLEIESGLNHDYITLAIWALSKSFLRPTDLLHGDIKDIEKCLSNPLEFGNDPYFQPEYSHFANIDPAVINTTFRISKRLSIPSLSLMESEIMYRENSKETNENSNAPDDQSSDFGLTRALYSSEGSVNPQRVSWYEYEDEHYSNHFRFYENMGLSSKEPLSLPKLVRKGLAAYRARARLQAEENMMSDQMFSNFVDAVSKNGFFNITNQEIVNYANGNNDLSEDEIMDISDKIHEERFRKVTAKFRTKLAANYDEKELEEQKNEAKLSKSKRNKFSEIKGLGSKIKKDESDTEEKKCFEERDEVTSHIISSRSRGGLRTFSKQQLANEADFDKIDDEINHDIDKNEEMRVNQFSEDAKDDATLVAESVFGEINAKENDFIAFPNDDESSRMSKSSRKVVVDKKDFETAERLKGYGNAAMQKKKYEKAKNYYTKALELLPAGPTSHVYFSNRAAALLSMRNFNEAVWDAERSLALKPEYAKAHARLGLAHFLLENYKDAVDSYTLAVQYDPSNKTSESYLEKSRKKLAAIEILQKNEVPKEEVVERTVKKQTHEAYNDDDDRSRGSNDYRNDRYREIDEVETSDRAMHKSRHERQLLEPTSNTIVQGDPPESAKTRASSSPMDFKSLRNRLDKAKHYNEMKARNDLEDELMRKSDPPEHSTTSDASTKYSDNQIEADRLKGLGNKAMAKKEYEKAVKYYSKSLRLAPAGTNSHVYFSNRAAALCYLERYEEAELDAERSLALNPEYGKAHARLGLSRYFLKDYYGAVEAYESALSIDPDNAASKSYLVKAKSKIGKRQARSKYYVE